jgi:putative flippase GtrA
MKKLAIKYFNDIFLKKADNGFYQFIRYLFAGGTATLVDITVLFILYHLLHVNYLVSAGISFVCGVSTNFTINITWVFKSKGKIKKEFILFVLIGIGGLLWTELILWILAGNFHFPVMAAKLVAVVLVLFWNFFMRKKFIF